MAGRDSSDTFAALLGIMSAEELAIFNQVEALERDAAARGVGHSERIDDLMRQLGRMRGLRD